MQYFAFPWILSVFTTLVQAVNYQVATGLQAAGGAVYSPDSLRVQPGDTIEFILIGVRLLLD
jgi:plastocyanin